MSLSAYGRVEHSAVEQTAVPRKAEPDTASLRSFDSATYANRVTIGERSAGRRLWLTQPQRNQPQLWLIYHSPRLDLRHRRVGRPAPTAKASARNRPVADARLRATSSGVPCATMRPPPVAALGPEVDDVVGRLDDVEVVLDDHDRVALIDELVRARRAACACPRSAGRSSARRGCRASGRCRAATAPSTASRAAPRRRTASSPTARARCSRGRRPAASAACWRSAGSSRAAAAPGRPSDRARRRSTCRGT